MTVNVTVDKDAIYRVFYSEQGPVFQYIRDLTEQVRNAAVRRAPRDTGHLATSIEAVVNVYGDTIVGRVGTRVEYAVYVHEGTGIYGPKKRRITPVSAKALVFEPGREMGPLAKGVKGTTPGNRGSLAPTRKKKSGKPDKFAGLIVVKSVKGSPPNPFLLDALEEVSPWPIVRRPLT